MTKKPCPRQKFAIQYLAKLQTVDQQLENNSVVCFTATLLAWQTAECICENVGCFDNFMGQHLCFVNGP